MYFNHYLTLRSEKEALSNCYDWFDFTTHKSNFDRNNGDLSEGMYNEDYKNAGLQMLPVINNGIKRTVLHIFLHALVLIPISTLPFFLGVSGRVYFVGAYILSNIYMLLCLPFILEQNKENARLIFKTSIYYFPLLLFLIVADLRV